MASIVITTQPASQVVPAGQDPQDVLVVATYDGADVLAYQWYSCDAAGANRVIIETATTDTLTLGTMTPGSTHNYICELSASDVVEDVLTAVVAIVQNGQVPVLTSDYTTGADVHDYIAQMSAEVQARFVSEQAFRGIEIPDTAVPLRSAQMELVRSII